MPDLAAELGRLDPAREWEPWRPAPNDPWGLKWAGHLHRRAAFGGSWPGLKAAVKAGPEATVERLGAGGGGDPRWRPLAGAAPRGRVSSDLHAEVRVNECRAGCIDASAA